MIYPTQDFEIPLTPFHFTSLDFTRTIKSFYNSSSPPNYNISIYVSRPSEPKFYKPSNHPRSTTRTSDFPSFHRVRHQQHPNTQETLTRRAYLDQPVKRFRDFQHQPVVKRRTSHCCRLRRTSSMARCGQCALFSFLLPADFSLYPEEQKWVVARARQPVTAKVKLGGVHTIPFLLRG